MDQLPLLYSYPYIQVPGYSKIIKTKMSLYDMGVKVRREDYDSFDDFAEDAKLISDNCFKFNAYVQYYIQVTHFFAIVVLFWCLSLTR